MFRPGFRLVVSMLLVSIVAAFAGCTRPAPADPKSADADLVVRAGAPLFEGMGDYHRPINTRDPGAQRYFDQGMVLAFGFNHAEAIRSFRAAQKLDPQCAMCFWGEALATGPNINVTSKGKAIMSPADRKAAYAAAQRAVALQGQRERRRACAHCGARDPLRRQRDLRSRSAGPRLCRCDEVGGRAFPDDDDAAAIYAEAWMNTMPWDYWSADGAPKPETVEVMNALERIIARSPRHPLALHLYIHAIEASKDPGRAEKAADTLATLVPGSGHLVHMPAHIYWRVGRYHDASEANVRAAGVDEAYIAQCNAQGFYPAMYYPHNIHFLWAASTMEGRSAVAIEAARKVAANVRLEQIEEFPTVEFFKTIPLVGLVQFGRWDEILAEPAADEGLDYAHGDSALRARRRARPQGRPGRRARRAGCARPAARLGQGDVPRHERHPATTLLTIADKLLQGEIALADKSRCGHSPLPGRGRGTGHPALHRAAVLVLPDAPVARRGTAEGRRFADAEAVYRKDLEAYPHNGWSMFGLAQSLEAQGKTEEAAKVREMFEHAWERADVTLQASRV